MGRPIKFNPRPLGTTRRGFFQQFGSGALALGSAPVLLAGATRAMATEPATGVFQHGVASGDPLANRVILWTRVTPPSPVSVINVTCVVATDPALTRIVATGVSKTNPSRDYTVKFDPVCLQPGTTYYYQFTALGEKSPVGRTRTLPVGSTGRARIAVASCSNHAYGYFNAYRRIAERADLDLVVHLGDYLYEYGPNQYGSVRTPEPAREMVSLADYRQRHAQYKRDADCQEVHRQHPFICIWDDHEITNDAWKDGAENHTEGAEGAWVDRVTVGLQAYYEWMPVRIPDAAQRRKNQRAFRIGDLIDLVMLEERLSARSLQLPTNVNVPGLGPGFVQIGAFADPTRTLLGDEQEAWLATRLRTSTATWKLIGQGVMFTPTKLVAGARAAGGGVFFNPDQWNGYEPARDRVFDIFKGDGDNAPVDNCVVLTGDIHTSWVSDLTQDPNNPFVYTPATGAGSSAVEFVGTSITSPGLNDPGNAIAGYLRSQNPHIKHIDLNQRGYMLLDATPQRVVCEHWFVDTVAAVSNVQTFGIAFQVVAGTNHVQAAAQTMPPANPPAPAP